MANTKYIESVGRRKTSIARVRITSGKGSFTVNGKDIASYFLTEEQRTIATEGLSKVGLSGKFDVTVKVKGGGIHSQAEAVRHGVARSIIESDTELRKKIKTMGFLKRDPRAKERRKFGLKKARKAPQWSKR